MASLHDFTMKTIDGKDQPLADYAGKVLLVVNVASKCGLTPHYEGLQQVFEKYQSQDFEVLGFPCNQFGGQEPGSDSEVNEFCTTNYGVSFPMFSKIEVNGAGQHPLYGFLTSAESQPDGSGDIAWNFSKFVVNQQGEVVGRFPPQTEPEADELTALIDKTLG